MIDPRDSAPSQHPEFRTLLRLLAIDVRSLPPKIARLAAVEVNPETATLEFTAHVRDAEDDTVMYFWDFGDGEKQEGQEFKMAGTYPVILTVGIACACARNGTCIEAGTSSLHHKSNC